MPSKAPPRSSPLPSFLLQSIPQKASTRRRTPPATDKTQPVAHPQDGRDSATWPDTRTVVPCEANPAPLSPQPQPAPLSPPTHGLTPGGGSQPPQPWPRPIWPPPPPRARRPTSLAASPSLPQRSWACLSSSPTSAAAELIRKSQLGSPPASGSNRSSSAFLLCDPGRVTAPL